MSAVNVRVLQMLGLSPDFDPERIGQGVFGTVYLVENKNGEKLALKVIPKDKFTEQKEREWTTSQKIRNQHCPFLIDYLTKVEMDTNVYILTSYANKGNLSDYVRQNPDLFGMNEFTKRIIYQILTGVKVIHEKKVVHRDLKGENILLHEENGRFFCKIIDFGFARFLEGGPVTVLGSPLNMAPEILRNKRAQDGTTLEEGEQYDQKVDIWALGVFFFQLISKYKSNIFPARNIMELTRMHEEPRNRNAPHIAPYFQANINATMGPAAAAAAVAEADNWWNLIKNMLDSDPETRFNIKQLLKQPLFISICDGPGADPEFLSTDPSSPFPSSPSSSSSSSSNPSPLSTPPKSTPTPSVAILLAPSACLGMADRAAVARLSFLFRDAAAFLTAPPPPDRKSVV